jgi:tRNA nucleotidyltransferase (CCA-adding enzyme)
VTSLTRSDIPPAVERVLAIIRTAGGDPMLVGGFVRDAVLRPGAPGKDVDIEVYGPVDMDRLAYALAEAGFNVNLVGMSFSVLTVRAGGIDMDIAPPRLDSKTGAGHRGFTVVADGTLSYAEASARRDFTVNSLMADPVTGQVLDWHGGLADLRAGILRHPSAAFSEDPLRVLRGVQFAARFGFRMDPATATLCRQLTGEYALLAKERVWGEIQKIGVLGTDITAALTVLADTGWEQHFPQIAALHGIRQDRGWHPEGDVWVHSGLAASQAARLADEAGLAGADRLVVVMAALLHDLGKVTCTQRGSGWWDLARVVLRGPRWRISSYGHAEAGVAPARAFLHAAGCPAAVTARITPLVREHMNCIGRPTKPAVRRLARRLADGEHDPAGGHGHGGPPGARRDGPATLTELALVIGADNAGRGDSAAPNPAETWLEVARTLTVTERPPKGLLTGHHLIAAGMTPGPAFKPVLAAALEAQDAGEFGNEIGAVHWLTRYLDQAGAS